jgi:recombinational DNA repair protein RecR
MYTIVYLNGSTDKVEDFDALREYVQDMCEEEEAIAIGPNYNGKICAMYIAKQNIFSLR